MKSFHRCARAILTTGGVLALVATVGCTPQVRGGSTAETVTAARPDGTTLRSTSVGVFGDASIGIATGPIPGW